MLNKVNLQPSHLFLDIYPIEIKHILKWDLTVLIWKEKHMWSECQLDIGTILF